MKAVEQRLLAVRSAARRGLPRSLPGKLGGATGGNPSSSACARGMRRAATPPACSLALDDRRRHSRTSAACRPRRAAAISCARRSAKRLGRLALEIDDDDVAAGDQHLAQMEVAMDAGAQARRRLPAMQAAQAPREDFARGAQSCATSRCFAAAAWLPAPRCASSSCRRARCSQRCRRVRRRSSGAKVGIVGGLRPARRASRRCARPSTRANASIRLERIAVAVSVNGVLVDDARRACRWSRPSRRPGWRHKPCTMPARDARHRRLPRSISPSSGGVPVKPCR